MTSLWNPDSTRTYDFTELRPTSACLVATASRTWNATTSRYELPDQFSIQSLNSGTFTVLTDIKNIAKPAALAGFTWESKFEEFPDWAPNWTAYGQPVPVVPPLGLYGMTTNAVMSEVGEFYPRGSTYLNQVGELTPTQATMRSIGLSSGRSFVKAIPATDLVDQKLMFVPPVRDLIGGNKPTVTQVGLDSWFQDIPSEDMFSGQGKYGWTKPAGAATFVQSKEFQPLVEDRGSDGQAVGVHTDGFGQSTAQRAADPISGSVFIKQLLPYALGHDSTPWITVFPDIAGPDWGRAQFWRLAAMGWCTSNNTAPSYVAGPVATISQANLPFTLPIVQRTTASLSLEYTYNSPYVLLPEDKLILGFQPAIGGMNEGAPKMMNTPSNPWCLADSAGARGLHANDYSGSIPMCVPNMTGSITSQTDWFDPVRYLPNLFEMGHNRVNLSEQIRQTILNPSPHGKLVLYGTLLRDNKPLPSELNQPLVTNAIHEALHSDNPIVDQFMVDDKTAYKGSYLDQYITGSTRLSLEAAPGGSTSGEARGVDATGFAGDLSFDAAFERFVTLTDDNEVYWDSVLPDPFQMWEADNITVIQKFDADGNVLLYNAFYTTNTYDSLYWPGSGAVNRTWPRSFPFEARYDGVSRILKDPGATDRPSVTIFIDDNDPAGASTPTVSWLRSRSDGAPSAVSAYAAHDPAPTANSGGNLQFHWANLANQSLTTADKSTAAVLFGYATSKGTYSIQVPNLGTPTGEDATPARIALNYNRSTGKFDHPEGVKYGLKNYVWSYTRAVFRPDRYGQFRDRLEQRRYTKFYHKGDEDNPRGIQESAVSCIFVDADGNPTDDATKTSCQNISTFMTSSIPYFEGEAQRTPTSNPFVSIDIGNMVSRTTLR
jgi:hypothetical protein